ncbi:unnamed protein product [Blepharisma stoltei]|uniref:Uncharacterized protein n=1 Tax=Blepharisma stoltei TaxID=1481888 RepID=A0AAU9ISN1_9CILI|nr:unnamed protein product [Blepharisma stoltei]
MHLNEKASRLLKTSIGNIIGTSLLNFIPQPFDVCHLKSIKDFVFNSSTIDLVSHKYLFFQNVEGHLVECNFLIKLTAFHNCAYFLISFEQRKTSREIAIISDEGLITGHSELFPFYIGSESKSLKGQNLSTVVPVLEINKMQDYEPWILPFNDGELAFIHKIREIKSTAIHELIIIHDQQEIKNWKEGIDQDQLAYFADQDVTCDYDQTQSDMDIKRRGMQVRYHSVSNFSLSGKSFDKVETEYLTNNDMVQTKELLNSCRSQDKKSLTEDHSKSSVGYKLPNQAKMLLVESKRKIRVLQVVLFLVMSSVIVTVGAILGYMITDVSYTTSLSSFKDLGQLLYNLGLSADLARIIDRVVILPDSTPEQFKKSIDDLINLITDLETVQGTIFEDFDQWSYCSSADIVTNSIIPLIYYDEIEPRVKYSNLYDAVSEIILNVISIQCKSMIKAVSEKEYYLNYVRFIFLNGIGNLFNHANSTMDGIVNCEMERVKNTGKNINILLICGFITLGILVLVIIGYIILVSQKHDEFWNFILNNAQWALAKLKSSAADRLILIHGIDYNSELSIDILGSRTKRKVRTSIYLHYIWRVMIFFAIAASYYLLIYCYLYPNCETLMINRPKLLSNFNIRRSNLRRLSMFSREILAHYIEFRMPHYFEFANAWTMVRDAENIIKLKHKELRESELRELMSSELEEKIYESVESSSEILKYGSEAAINSIIDDCENQGYYKFLPTASAFALLADVVIIQNEISYEFELADRDSKDLIKERLNSIVYTTAAYSVTMCALFFCYYLPYLNKQVKQLNRFSILSTILPMEPE